MANSSTAPRPSPTIPTGGLFSPFAEATVSAPPSAVYKTLVDTSTWGDWNDFVPSVTIDKQPSSSSNSENVLLLKDMFLTFKINMSSTGGSTTSKEIITQVDEAPNAIHPGKITRICWIMDNKASMTPRFLLSAERVNEIEDLGNGTCLYRSWQAFGGPLARIIKWKYEDFLKSRFQEWVTGLKQYVEAKEQQARERSTAVEMPA